VGRTTPKLSTSPLPHPAAPEEDPMATRPFPILLDIDQSFTIDKANVAYWSNESNKKTKRSMISR
jgi:hypothetical protein